jgi:hypothetical protein
MVLLTLVFSADIGEVVSLLHADVATLPLRDCIMTFNACVVANPRDIQKMLVSLCVVFKYRCYQFVDWSKINFVAPASNKKSLFALHT